ncbi:MAG: DUF2809 domain-containing protein [Lachnospiraceae bacterium]|nr:DUF2809 domain-containing protein [Lachnospiraceae bacterium]
MWGGSIFYAAAFFVLLAVEVLIALFLHSAVVRPYLGDVLVVIVVYCFAQIFLLGRCRHLPLYVFFFAVGVEVLQYFHLAEHLGLGGNRFLRVLLGSVFDWKDIACYTAGCILLVGWERLRVLVRRKGENAV